MTTGSTGSLFPKWQLAVILGAPVAIGLGYLYYRNQSTENKDGKSAKVTLADLKEKTISLDGEDKGQKQQEDKPIVPKKALTPLEQATQFKNEGNLCFKRGKYDEAISCYDKAIEVCGSEHTHDLSTFYQNRAAAYEQLKKWPSVKSDCTSALELNPRYAKALHRRARANEHIDDLSSSLEDITATCILEGFENSSSLAFADRVLKEMGRRDALIALQTRTPSFPSNIFIKTYFQSFTQDPITKIIVASSNPKGFVRAKIALETSNYKDVISACTEEIESSESETEYKTEATLLRGTFYLLTGCPVEALADFDNIINNNDVPVILRVNALIKKASLNIQSGNAELGFENFAMAETLDPNNADIYHQRGQVYILTEQLDKALEEFTTAVRLSPEQGITFVQKCYAEYRIAIMTQDQMLLLDVMTSLQKAIEQFPNCVECYSIMAQVLTEQGQYPQADTFYEKAIALQPLNAGLLVHRGIMQMQWNGDVAKAIAYMKHGIVVDDKCGLAFETLGTIEVQRGNLENSVEMFESAITLAKSEAELIHLYALRNAAIAQINVAKKLGIDMSTLSALGSGQL